MLTLIAARARNGAIGKDGTLPWHVPEDLKFFKRETLGGALIMGRRTWESLPFRPLKDRLNLVVTSTLDLPAHAVPDLDAAMDAARAAGYARIYGIGGERVFRDLLPRADRLLITEIDVEVAGADAFFPDFDAAGWQEVTRFDFPGDGPRATLRELVVRRP
ncbi:dihydrofolate reductase [Paracoccus sp. S1E-3]|uniref:dihydrofolate reductase n=1 Tax=Paracoccus sp. S1E-3 TaxID=2756130 RepID=UPI0015EEBAF0|nr:dihydrofolate reductase [Paracoccus sp. S1E-3]MBA4490065.1 dihydrofolate reductase [Paracoccus sp. S1E-3]